MLSVLRTVAWLTVSVHLALLAAFAGPRFVDVRAPAGSPSRSVDVASASLGLELDGSRRLVVARAAAAGAAGDEAWAAAPLEWKLVGRTRSRDRIEHFVFRALWDGVEVFDSERSVHLAPGRRIVQYSEGGRIRAPAAARRRLTEEEARASLIAYLALPLGDLVTERSAKKVWFPLSSGLRPAWRLYVALRSGEAYEGVIDDIDGSVLFLFPLARRADPAGRVFAAPGTAHPDAGGRTLESWQGYPGSGVCPADIYPAELVTGAQAGRCWTDGAVTTGNNADACLDLTGNNLCGGRATGSGGIFDFPFADSYGTSGDPTPDRPAALANAFYWANAIHDWLYRLGFDEPAGAFQQDNFGRGGFANDAVRVDVQDAGNVNNASFVTPPDGIAPRMQLGLFPGLQRDSAFDGDVMVHEYVHGMTSRLVAGPTSVSGLFLWQSGALSEGWSDAYAIVFTDDPVMGEYVTRNPTTGIRTVRYDQSALTFGRFGALRAALVPGTTKVLPLPQVHGDGEIWASALWDLRQALGRASWEAAVTAGVKMTPARPSMLDARDAIVQAIELLGGDECAAWTVFAARGLGASAALNPIESNQPNDTALSVYEAFDLPLSCGGSAPPQTVTAFFDDAESDAGWAASGLWHRSGRRSASGGMSWWFGSEAAGTYATGARETGELISPAIDLTTADAAELEWEQVYRGPGFFTPVNMGSLFAPYLNADSGRVWISTDGGASWALVTHIAHQTPGSGFVTFRLNLARWVGSSVRIKFEMDTFDGADNGYEGWFLDDIRVTTAGGAAPLLEVAPGSLVFDAQAGSGDPPSLTLEVTNGGGPGLGWTAAVTAGGGWLSASPGAGVEGGTVAVSVVAAGLAPGSYVGLIRVSAGAAGVLDTPVTLTVAPPVGPVAAWSFEEAAAGPGVPLADQSGQARTVSTEGQGTAAVDGVVGSARLFNGYSDAATSPPSLAFTPDGFTFRTWLKIFDLPPKVGAVVSAFGGSNYKGWYLAIDAQGHAIFMAAAPPSSAPWLVTQQTIEPGRWTMLTVTYDPVTRAARVYLDAALAAAAVFPGLAADATRPLTLGKASWAETWRLHAALDETEILPSVKTAAEVAADFTAFSPPSPVADLVTGAAWSFDQHLLDGSGNGHSGAAIGGEYVPGVVGQARRFDGVDDFVTIPADELLTPRDMTVRAWVRMNEASAGWGAMIANYNADFEGWYLGALASGQVFVGLAAKPSSLPSVVSPAALGVGVWRHVTVVYEGQVRRLSLFVDGELVDREYVSGLTPRTSGDLILGRASWINLHYTSFDLDELLIGARAWTEAEVAADFAGFPAPAPPGALAEWRFDETTEGAGATLADSSGGGHTIVAGGAGHAPQSGVYGSARWFSGAAGSGLVAASPDFSTSSFSFSAWVRLDRYPSSWGAIFSTYDGDHRGWYVAVRSDGGLILCVGGQPAAAPWLVTGQALELGKWQHIAVTFEGASRRGLMYLNGVRAAGAVFPAWTPQTGTAPTFGRASWAAAGYLGFWLDEARLEGRERSADEIAAEHALGTARQSPTPIAEWSFDETGVGAGAVVEESVAGRDATLFGLGGTPVGGVDGGARRLAGAPDFAKVTAAAALSPATFSWTGWVKLEALPAGWGVLFANHAGDSRGWHGSVFTDGRLIFSVSGLPSSNPWLMSVNALQPGVWHHVAFTFDGVARRGSIYLDGVLERTAVFPGYTPQSDVDPTFGKASWSESYYLPVSLDRVRLYGVELSAQELAGEM